MMASNNDAELTLAWNWFALHSGQRLQLVNFWLVAVAFLVAGFVQAIVSHLPWLAFGIALLGFVASISFWQLDERTRHLIGVAEQALSTIEERKRNSDGYALDLVTQANLARGSRFQSYRIVIQVLQLSGAGLFAAGSIGAFFMN
jgi:hypothetical protein